jgi:hypothetical protein
MRTIKDWQKRFSVQRTWYQLQLHTDISTMSAPTVVGLQVGPSCGVALPVVCTQGAPTANNEDLCNEDLSVRLRVRDMER